MLPPMSKVRQINENGDIFGNTVDSSPLYSITMVSTDKLFSLPHRTSLTDLSTEHDVPGIYQRIHVFS